MKEIQRSTAFNVITTIVTRFVLLFGGFIISIILARLLGPAGKGVITAVFVFPLLIVSLADMGVRQSTAYFVGKNEHKLSDIISSVAFLWLITSFMSVFLVFLYFLFGPSDQYSWIILIIAIASVPLKLIEQYSQGILLGRNQISVINYSQIIKLIVNFAFVLILVWLFDLGVLGAAIVQIILAGTIAIYYLYKISRYQKIKFKPISPLPKLLFYRGFGFAAVLFIINLNYKIDIMILDRLVAPQEIGIYSVGVNFAELLWQVPSAVGMVLFAKSTTAKNKFNSIERATTILRMVLPIMIVASIFIAIFAPLIISLLYGESFTEAGNLLRILLPGICFITISKILHPELAGRGYPLYALRVFIVSLVINVVLNFMLIPEYGTYGAAYASTISYILAGIGFGYVYSRKEEIQIKELLILKKRDLKHIYDFYLKKIRKK